MEGGGKLFGGGGGGGGYDHVKIKIKKQMYETSCFSKNAE